MNNFSLSNNQFFLKSGPFSLLDILTQSNLLNDAVFDLKKGDYIFNDVTTLKKGTASDISFFNNRHYLEDLINTKSGAVLIKEEYVDKVPEQTIAIILKDPYLAWARIVSLFYKRKQDESIIDKTASITKTASIGKNVSVGAFSVIKEGAIIGDNTYIGSHVVIDEHVFIGKDCRIEDNITIRYSIIGHHCVFSSGVRIGQDGFGFAYGPEGFETVPQIGRVLIGNNVYIGANTTIDRGSMCDTVIGDGTRIDNLVQIGHNVHIGKNCIIVAQAGISGSTILEDGVVIAAQAGLIGHIQIGKGAKIGAQCGVMSDIAAGNNVIGSPAMPFKEFFRNIAILKKLSKKKKK